MGHFGKQKNIIKVILAPDQKVSFFQAIPSYGDYNVKNRRQNPQSVTIFGRYLRTMNFIHHFLQCSDSSKKDCCVASMDSTNDYRTHNSFHVQTSI